MNDKNITIRLIVAVVAFGFGCLLVIASFVCPPVGMIDASVLTAFGEALSFAGAIFGIDTSYRKKKLELEGKDE